MPASQLRYDPERQLLCVKVKVAFRNIGGRRVVITPADDGQFRHQQRNIAQSVARAHRWQAALESGRYRNITELAAAIGRDTSFVARHLRLTLLAPDIVEAILDGRIPAGVTLNRLILKGLPASWVEQRLELGFAGERVG